MESISTMSMIGSHPGVGEEGVLPDLGLGAKVVGVHEARDAILEVQHVVGRAAEGELEV